MNRLRGQISELLLLPALACPLPWSWGFALSRQLSRLSGLYTEPTRSAEAAAAATGLFETGPVWRRQYRLNRLVDGIDPWLSLTRSDRWMDRQLEVEGAWPESPFLAASIHWGTGTWALRHIHRHAGPVSMVLRPESEWGPHCTAPMRAYLRATDRRIAAAGGAAITRTGSGVKERIAQVFEAGHNLLVLVDVPRGGNRDQFPVEFLGRPTYFPNGIVNIVLEMGIPIVPYSIGLDFSTGRRRLEILPAIEADDIRGVMNRLAGYFNELIRRQSPGWQFWHLSDAFLSPDFTPQAPE